MDKRKLFARLVVFSISFLALIFLSCFLYKLTHCKISIAAHREVDRGITRYKGKDNRAHDDPWNFDLKKFYDLLFNKYDITIIKGVDGMTLERFEEPSRPENKIHWPPVLKGPVEND